MLMIISPAKTLDFEHASPTNEYTTPDALDRSQELINILKRMDSFEVAELMKISMKLADLNSSRFHSWQTPFTPDNAKQSLFAFMGDVYTGLNATTLDSSAIAFAQKHLRILSGLYGLLRPLDLMQAYRLEMGTKLANPHGETLYDFWGNTITEMLNHAIVEQGDHILINLASNEYFKSVQSKTLDAEIITPIFKEKRNDGYKVISFSAKKARGMMCRYIIDKQLNEPDKIKDFNLSDYAFNEDLSSANEWVFTR